MPGSTRDLAEFELADLETAIAADYPAVRAMQESEDFVAGPLAFAEKRPPQWKGR